MNDFEKWQCFRNKETNDTLFAVNAITEDDKIVTIYSTDKQPVLRVAKTTDFLLKHELIEPELQSLHLEHGIVEIKIKAHEYFFNSMVNMLDDYMNDVDNWKSAEIQKTHLEMVTGRYEVIVRKVTGKTQSDTIRELRQRIGELEAEKRGI